MLLTGRQLHRSFPDSFIIIIYSISMFVTVSQNSVEGDVFSAMRRISVHKLKAIIKILRMDYVGRLLNLMSITSLLSG